MKFGGFKIGKSKGGNGKENAASGGAKAIQIAELEEQLNGQTKNLKQTEEQLKKLSGKGKKSKENDEVLVKPHGPIKELSIDPEDKAEADTFSAAEESDIVPEASAEKVKLVEVKVEAVAPPAVKEAKAESIGDSLNSLFSSNEEEENPLASLIRTLPDVDAKELIEDLNEIKGIIKEWQKK